MQGLKDDQSILYGHTVYKQVVWTQIIWHRNAESINFVQENGRNR